MGSQIETHATEQIPATPAQEGRRVRVLHTLRWVILMMSLPFGILGFALPVYGKEIGANAVQIGLFFSVFFLMTVLLRPVVGAGVDRIGRRPFFIAGLVGYALTMFTFAFIDQVWVIVAARTLQGVASALLWLSARAIATDVTGAERRGRALGGIEQAANQGGIVGSFIGFGVFLSLGVDRGWSPLFIGYGVATLAGALLAVFRMPETNPQAHQTVRRPIVWSRPWVLLLLVTAVTGASATMLSPILMIFLQERLTVGVEALAWAFLPAALVGALLPTHLGRLADRFGRKPLMVVGMAVAAGTSFLIPSLASLVALAALWALQALCYCAGDPAEQALVADLTGGDQRGRAYGFYAMAAGLGATVGPLAGGWLYEAVGPWAPFYANGIVLALCTLALALFLREPGRHHADALHDQAAFP